LAQKAPGPLHPRMQFLLALRLFALSCSVIVAENVARGKCWESSLVEAACCEGVWGGTGCWEKPGLTFERCCEPASSIASSGAPEQQQRRSGCAKRFAEGAAVVQVERVRELLAEPVAAQVRSQSRALLEAAEPGARSPGVGPLAAFVAGPTAFELEQLLALVAWIAQALQAHGVTFWAHGSTLLGVLRHYGPVPWLEDAMLGAFATEPASVVAALQSAAREHPTFGPVAVVPDESCGAECGRWVLSFARGVRSAGLGDGVRTSVSVDWFDARGESLSWQRHFDVGRGTLSHRQVLGLMLPASRLRPFGPLMLHVPHDPWGLLDAFLAAPSCGGERRFLEACELRTCRPRGLAGGGLPRNESGARPNARLPCAALASVFPMVLARRSFASVAALRRELGGAASKSAVAVAPAPPGSPSPGKRLPAPAFSVEVAADAVRGAYPLFIAEAPVQRAEVIDSEFCAMALFGHHGILMVQQSAPDGQQKPMR